jgi:M-phase inducer tyrosine phosphatase
MPDMSEDDEDISYDSPSVSATHAEYSRRHNPRMADHIDGSPGFRPTMSAGIVPQCQASPAGNKGKKTSPYGPGGLPGFGDNEMDGKILPCHKVKEDGLVRITPDTVSLYLLLNRLTVSLKTFWLESTNIG